MTTVPTTGPATGPANRPPRSPATLPMTPGRWLALAIGVPVALALIGWTGFSLLSTLGQASFPVNTTVPLDHGLLTASMNGADIVLRPGHAENGQARLTGTAHYSLVRPSLAVHGGDLKFQCRIPTGDCGLDARLAVPPGTAVSLATGGGNMQVSALQSSLTLNSGGGDVTVSGPEGPVTADTGGGNVTAENLGGTLRFSTGGGDVDGHGLSARTVTTDSGGGNVTLVFSRPPANLAVTSGGGDITILLPPGETEYAITDSPGGGDYSRARTVHINSAAPNRITVDSGGGNIRIATS
jgi:putative adhesin